MSIEDFLSVPNKPHQYLRDALETFERSASSSRLGIGLIIKVKVDDSGGEQVVGWKFVEEKMLRAYVMVLGQSKEEEENDGDEAVCP
jgi:hypothetical protein